MHQFSVEKLWVNGKSPNKEMSSDICQAYDAFPYLTNTTGTFSSANTETPTQTPAFTDGVQKLETWAQSSIHARTVNPIQIRVDPNRCNIHNLHWEFISWATLLSQSDTVSETHMLAGYAEMTKIKTNPPKCEDKIWHVRPGSQICLRGYLYGLSWHSLIWVMTDFIQKLFWMM